MTRDRAWLGQIFIGDEGGFDVIMRALDHYGRRLRHVLGSPEIAGAAAMLGSILQSESARTARRLGPIADRLRAGLTDASVLAGLEGDVDTIERAMACYRSDCRKAAGGAHPYYAGLVEGNAHYMQDLAVLDDCIRKLRMYG